MIKIPNYVYECSECGNKFEAIKSIADRYNTICECGRKATLVISFNGSIKMGSVFRFFADDGAMISDGKRTDREPRSKVGGYEKRH